MSFILRNLRSSFFRCAGYPATWAGTALMWLGYFLCVPGLIVCGIGVWMERGGSRLWAKQDFRGPNPRGWGWR